MAASELAYGEGHIATFSHGLAPATRKFELSGEMFGDDQPGIPIQVTGGLPSFHEDAQRDM